MQAEQILEGDLEENTQYLTFVLANEEYAIDILKVQEIRGFERTTRIPNTPDYLLGVINLRGAVVPIVDLRVHFSLAADDNSTAVIILVKLAKELGGRVIGIVVDGVSDVHAISSDDVSDTPDLASNVVKMFVTGLASIGEKMIIMLDIDSLIASGVLDHKLLAGEDEQALSTVG